MDEGTETTEVMDHEDELWAAVEARQAAEDAPYDEYGIAQPHKSNTERWVDEVAPPEIMNDPEVGDLEKIGRAFAAAPVALAGHFADNLPIPGVGFNVPVLSELAHGEEVARYNRERAAYEEELARQAQEAHDAETAAARAQYAPEDATDPEVAQSWYAPEEAAVPAE